MNIYMVLALFVAAIFSGKRFALNGGFTFGNWLTTVLGAASFFILAAQFARWTE